MTSEVSQSILAATKRLLKVALVGAPNAGKSTLLNRLISSDISCVSNKVHTTRRNILGVVTEGNAQLEFYDSPGVVTRQHLLKHRLEDSLYQDPIEASNRCDLIAVVIDASNERERRRLNRGILSILANHSTKKSFLILNKTDLVKDKRLLLDIGTRLTEGCLEGCQLFPQAELDELNRGSAYSQLSRNFKITSKHVIELDKKDNVHDAEDGEKEVPVGWRNFSQLFSISALTDDGVDDLRECMIQLAIPIETWPHSPDYLTNQKPREIVHSVIRGKVMDNVDHELPYVTKFNYKEFRYDDLGALHLNLQLVVPKKYMIGKLLGQHGVTIFKIINESREVISKTLACDVKLNIAVESK